MKGKGWDFFPDGMKVYNWNPITGCGNMCLMINESGSKYIVVGCATPDYEPYCYEAAFCNRFKKSHSFEFQFHEDRLDKLPKKPSIVVVGSAGDMWGWAKEHRKEVRRVLAICSKHPEHFYVFLTKFPDGYLLASMQSNPKFKFPSNCLCGVTVTRLNEIEKINTLKESAVFQKLFLMLEPCFFTEEEARQLPDDIFANIDWLVIGAMTGGKKAVRERWYPSVSTLNTIRKKAKSQKVPIFMKPNLSYYDHFMQEYPACFQEWHDIVKDYEYCNQCKRYRPCNNDNYYITEKSVGYICDFCILF